MIFHIFKACLNVNSLLLPRSHEWPQPLSLSHAGTCRMCAQRGRTAAKMQAPASGLAFGYGTCSGQQDRVKVAM